MQSVDRWCNILYCCTLWALRNKQKPQTAGSRSTRGASLQSGPEMFVTILFGDSRMEMFNPNCKLINFLHHLKERCGLDFTECVDLMDSSGRVMNLEGKQHSEALASSVLEERQYYVLLQVCRDEDTGGRKYVSLLNNSQSHPELTELLRKLSNSEKTCRKMRGQTQRSKNTSASNKKQKK